MKRGIMLWRCSGTVLVGSILNGTDYRLSLTFSLFNVFRFSFARLIHHSFSFFVFVFFNLQINFVSLSFLFLFLSFLSLYKVVPFALKLLWNCSGSACASLWRRALQCRVKKNRKRKKERKTRKNKKEKENWLLFQLPFERFIISFAPLCFLLFLILNHFKRNDSINTKEIEDYEEGPSPVHDVHLYKWTFVCAIPFRCLWFDFVFIELLLLLFDFGSSAGEWHPTWPPHVKDIVQPKPQTNKNKQARKTNKQTNQQTNKKNAKKRKKKNSSQSNFIYFDILFPCVGVGVRVRVLVRACAGVLFPFYLVTLSPRLLCFLCLLLLLLLPL